MKPICIVFLVLIVFVVLTLLLTFIVSLGMKKTFNKRGDGSISIRYQLPSELKNAEINRGYILTKGNYKLSYLTYKKKNTNPKALILVIHGIGYGHFYLLPLIQKFIDDGYMVMAYDQFASGSSQGKLLKTMSRGSVDIKYVLKYIESNSNLNNFPLYVFGHSWGGYVSGFTLRYSNKIEKLVDVSGFDNECDFVRPLRLFAMLRNFLIVGKNAFIRNKSNFKKTTAKVYYLQGVNDYVVQPRFAGEMYKKLFVNKPNIAVEILTDKGHTPFNDDECQTKQDKILSNFGFLGGVLVPFDQYVDFRKISKVDENIYQKIISFYESK